MEERGRSQSISHNGPSQASHAFEVIDQNRDGLIDRAEWLDAMKASMPSESPARHHTSSAPRPHSTHGLNISAVGGSRQIGRSEQAGGMQVPNKALLVNEIKVLLQELQHLGVEDDAALSQAHMPIKATSRKTERPLWGIDWRGERPLTFAASVSPPPPPPPPPPLSAEDLSSTLSQEHDSEMPPQRASPSNYRIAGIAALMAAAMHEPDEPPPAPTAEPDALDFEFAADNMREQNARGQQMPVATSQHSTPTEVGGEDLVMAFGRAMKHIESLLETNYALKGQLKKQEEDAAATQESLSRSLDAAEQRILTLEASTETTDMGEKVERAIVPPKLGLVEGEATTETADQEQTSVSQASEATVQSIAGQSSALMLEAEQPETSASKVDVPEQEVLAATIEEESGAASMSRNNVSRSSAVLMVHESNGSPKVSKDDVFFAM